MGPRAGACARASRCAQPLGFLLRLCPSRAHLAPLWRRQVAELEALESPEEILRKVLARDGEELKEEALLEGLTSDKLETIKGKM